MASPIAGVDWNPSQEERGKVRELFNYFTGRLGELRAMIGLHVARLAVSYNLAIPGELEVILPNKPGLQAPAAPGAGHETAAKVKPRVNRKRRIHRPTKNIRQR